VKPRRVLLYLGMMGPGLVAVSVFSAVIVLTTVLGWFGVSLGG
jgi:hypothetical protein